MCVSVRRIGLAFSIALIAVSCTGSSSPPHSPAAGSASLFLPSPTTSGSGPTASEGPPPIVLSVVATTSGSLAAEDQGYLEGMRLAVQEIDEGRGVSGRRLALEVYDDGGDPGRATDLLRAALDEKPPAILYVGPGEGLAPLRERFAQAGAPVFLFTGDLYTSHGLFPEAFQTTIPWEWQANVIARYLVVDRRAGRTVFVGAGSDADVAATAAGAALAYWGGKLSATVTTTAGGPLEGVRSKARGADAVIAYGSATDTDRIAQAVARLRDPPRVAAATPMLSADPHPRPGTVACQTYAWAGWAQPIPRVGAFRTAFAAMTGGPPSGGGQEGYDAVRLLAWGLRRTRPAGGPELLAQLEQAHGVAYAGFPIDLGPDDHLLPPRDQLGLFAVAGPDETVDPWQIPGTEPWRAIMRTFTYDGRRTSILDTDRTVFFPWWNDQLPGPHYWRSIYGIATRPNKDAVH
jgi:ABC-type branched-subunit amino acid transport system substrate-binding protein